MNLVPFTTSVEDLTVRGSLYLPAHGTGPYPVAVLFHGFGGNRTEMARLFVDTARRLTAAGVAVLAWDRVGHGESDGEFFDTEVTRDVRHTHAVVAALAEHPEVDTSDLHLVGLSLGAVIAAAAAASSPVPVRSVTLWSTAAVFVDEIASGSIQGMPLDSIETQGYLDFLGQRVGPAIVRDALAFDPYAAASGYRGPVLLLHGTEDFVPVRYAERYLEVLQDAEIDVVEGADHGWLTVPHREHLLRRTVEHVAAHVAEGGRR